MNEEPTTENTLELTTKEKAVAILATLIHAATATWCTIELMNPTIPLIGLTALIITLWGSLNAEETYRQMLLGIYATFSITALLAASDGMRRGDMLGPALILAAGAILQYMANLATKS